ncbi:MAG: 2OG-Fe(II) oxygenase [Bacteroidota bacterium]
MKIVSLDTFLYLIEDFLSSQECDDLILWSEQKGYEDAKVQMYGKQVMLKAVRNNSRITFVDFDLSARIWEKFKPFAVDKFANSEVLGLNEMFRFYKYENGQRFKRHIDGSYIRNNEEASYFTLMIYLNDDFEGGSTTFQNSEVKPKKGTALVFYHGMKHAGEEIQSGTKYVLRTDVMYKLIK